jgi:hypothetical protein
MKSGYADRVFMIGRGLVVSWTMAALLLFGSSLISISTGTSADDEQGMEGRLTRITIGAKLPDPGKSMSKNNQPPAGKPFLLSTPAVIMSGPTDNARADCWVTDLRNDFHLSPGNNSINTTTAFISSKKAREFTLIGAKPSGTG